MLIFIGMAMISAAAGFAIGGIQRRERSKVWWLMFYAVLLGGCIVTIMGMSE